MAGLTLEQMLASGKKPVSQTNGGFTLEQMMAGGNKPVASAQVAPSFTFNTAKTPEQVNAEEKTRRANIFAGAEEAKAVSEKENSALGFTKNFVGGAGRAFFGSTFGLGESAVKAFGNQAENTGQNVSKLYDSNIQLLQAIREKKAKGGDTSNLERAYNENQKYIDTFNTNLDTEQNNLPTNLQVAGQGLGTLVDTLGFATLPGKATVGMKAGTLAKARPAILPKGQSGFFTKQTAKEVGVGTGLGYGYDVGQNLQGGKTGADIATPGVATGLGAGIPIVGRGLPALGRTIQKGYKGTGIALSPEKTMERVVGLNKSDYRNFQQKTGKRFGKYMNEIDAYGNIDEITEKVATRFETSKGRVDSRLAMIDGVYQPNEARDMIQDLVEQEQRIGRASAETRQVSEWANKFKNEGLDMSEINSLKRFYERNFKFGYNKLNSPDIVKRATRTDDALRAWQFKEALKRGFSDLPALNKETQATKEILNAIGKKYSGDANNAITLTDWLVLQNGDPTAVASYIVKKTVQAKGTLSAFARMRYKGEKTPLPQGNLTPTTQFPALPVGNRGQGSEVFSTQTQKVTPSGSPTGKYEVVKGTPFASTKETLPPQQNIQKISPKAYDNSMPQMIKNASYVDEYSQGFKRPDTRKAPLGGILPSPKNAPIKQSVVNEYNTAHPKLSQKLDALQTEKAILEDTIQSHEGKAFTRYANKNGELPEVLGVQRQGVFKQKGDDIAQTAGLSSSDDAQKALDDYKQAKSRLDDINKEIASTKSTLRQTPNPQRGALPLRTLTGAGVGSLAGFEKDENGNIKYDTKKGALGALFGAGAANYKGKPVGGMSVRNASGIPASVKPSMVAKALSDEETMALLRFNKQATPETIWQMTKMAETHGFGGAVDLRTLKEFAKQVQDEIGNLPLSKEAKQRMGGILPKAKTDTAQILRGTKGLTADDIMKTHPNIKLTKDVPATDIHGNKVIIPDGEKLTPYELKGNKILLQDGQTYIVSKNQFENIKGQSVGGEAKPFAPELQGLEETVKGDISSEDVASVKRFGRKNYQGGEGAFNGELVEITLKNGKKDSMVFSRDISSLSDKEISKEILTNTGRTTSTKYSQYQLPGGKNYKEVLIKAPIQESKGYGISESARRKAQEQMTFKSSHWDEPNVLAHLRLNERTYQGKKVAFMEELQSDWAREARAGKTEANNPNLKNWQELSVKRALKEAVDSKAEYFSWINGEQTSARYNLATHVKNVEWENIDGATGQAGKDYKIVKIEPQSGSTIEVRVLSDGTIKDASQSARGEWSGKKLDEVLGKGLADKIMEKETGTLSGEGLKFGGEWASSLYDRQVKNIVQDLTGGKVEMLDLGLAIRKDISWRLPAKGNKLGKLIDPTELKVGMKLQQASETSDKGEWIITDILGDGKFKAVPKKEWERYNYKVSDEEAIGRMRSIGTAKEESFDISQKTTTQQAIRLTKEIRDKINGIAPEIKTSGRMFTP